MGRGGREGDASSPGLTQYTGPTAGLLTARVANPRPFVRPFIGVGGGGRRKTQSRSGPRVWSRGRPRVWSRGPESVLCGERVVTTTVAGKHKNVLEDKETKM